MNPTLPTAEAERLLESLVRFCATHGRVCYGNWSPETLRDYLLFHMKQRTLAWVRDRAGLIVACGVAWQCRAADLRAASDPGRFFDWQPTNPAGDAVYGAGVVCTRPKALGALWLAFHSRFPNWPNLAVYAVRRDRLKRINLQRHFRKAFYGQRR